MATFNVTILGDTPMAGELTLREAVIMANMTVAADTIVLPAGTHVLTNMGVGEDASATGDLDITSEITIRGAGASATTIDAMVLGDRVLEVRNGSGDLTLEGVTITGGNGSGISNSETLTITNAIISDNLGPGIENNNMGGGEVLTITNTTISGNSAGGNGGGILNDANGTITITDSTISGNTASFNGGGIRSQGGDLTITNSTISGNMASLSGGGIYTSGGTITNSTIAGNEAGAVGTGDGGGIYSNGSVTVNNSIIAGNTDNDLVPNNHPNVSGTFVSNGANIIGDSTGSSDFMMTETGVSVGTVINTTLANNGGPTQTHALVSGSPAIGGSGSMATPNDQRGVAAVGTRDIGAFEFVPPPAVPSGPVASPFTPPATQEVHVPSLNISPNSTSNSIETDAADSMGTEANDNITLGSSNNILFALGGNDNAFGGDGNDFIQLNQGNDFARGQDGNDTIWGGMDDDYAEGNDGNDLLEGHIGDDTLWGADGDDSLFGGLGNALPVDTPDGEMDFLDGGNGNDFLNGNAGNDTVYGAAGDDTVLGGRNDDLVIGGSGNDFVEGQLGDDTVYGVFIDAADPGIVEIDTLTGGGGSDTFILGVSGRRYYDSSIATDDGGNRDYALLADFNPSADFIQLAGAATDYSLQETSGSLPDGIGIFFESSRPDELIAIVQGVAFSNLDLNSNVFQYI